MGGLLMQTDFPYPVPEELDDPRFRQIFDYWKGLFRQEQLPPSSRIDPLEFSNLLGSINLIGVVRDDNSMRFCYRLWGTKFTDLFGSDGTGKFVEEIFDPPWAAEIQHVFENVVISKKPHFWKIPVPIEDRKFLTNRRLPLPFSNDGTVVDTLLALMVED